MAKKSKRIDKGIILTPDTDATSAEGELKYNDSEKRVKYRDDAGEQEVVAKDKAQTITNKTIDSATNTITVNADEATVSELEVDNFKAGVIDTDLNSVSASDDTIPSAKATKDYVDAQIQSKDEASEIAFDDTNPNVTGTDVQAAVDDVANSAAAAATAASNAQTTADDHIADTTDAHTASAITNVPTGNLTATNVQGALDELQTDVDTRAVATDLTDHINDATGAHAATAISYDNTTSGLTATETQAAIDEVEGRVDSLESAGVVNTFEGRSGTVTAQSGDYEASEVTYSNATSGLTATNTQAAVDEVEGRLDTAETTLSTHVGSNAAHGTTGDVVGTTDTQTITNKTIQGASIETPVRSDVKKDTFANLQTYATTATNGETCYATDLKQYFGITDAVLVPLGGGSGSLDIFFQETWEVNDSTNITTGNAAAPDAAGTGTLDGTVADETTSPISGDRSIKYTGGASSTNDFFINDEDIEIDPKQVGQEVGVNFYYTYTGNDDEIKVVILDQDDNIISSTKDLIKAAATSQRFSTSVTIPTGATALRYGFQVVTGNNGAVLTYDDVEFTLNPFQYRNLQEENLFTARIQNNGTASISSESSPFIASVNRVGVGIVDITFITDFFSEIPSAVGEVNLASSSNKNLNISGLTASGCTVTTEINSSSPTNEDLDFSISIHRQGLDYNPLGEHVITPAKSNLTDWQLYTATIEGVGVDSQEVYYRRVGSEIEVRGFVEAGADNTNQFKFSLPSGLTLDTSVLANKGHKLGEIRQTRSGEQDANTTVNLLGNVFYDSTDTDKVWASSNMNTNASGDVFIGEQTAAWLGGSVNFAINFKAPIAEWSADVSFLAAIPLNLTQTKILSANVSSTGVISGFTCNNLTIGKIYNLDLSLGVESTDTSNNTKLITLSVLNGATQVDEYEYRNNDLSIANEPIAYSIKFEATDTTVTFDITSILRMQVRGNGTRQKSYITITEENYTKPTERF